MNNVLVKQIPLQQLQNQTSQYYGNPKNLKNFDISSLNDDVLKDMNKKVLLEKAQEILKFIFQFSFDLLIVFPLYQFYQFYEVFKDLNELKQRKMDFTGSIIQLFFCYLLDILLPLSVFGITFYAIIHLFSNDIYVYHVWCSNCFLLYFSFILLVSYQYNLRNPNEQFQCNTKYLFNRKRINSLGLGVVHKLFMNQIKQQEQEIYKNEVGINSQNKFQSQHFSQHQDDKQKLYEEFENQIEDIIGEIDIDLSLFLFDVFQLSQGPRSKQKLTDEQIQIYNLLEQTGLKTNQCAKKRVLWKIYKKSSQFFVQTNAPISLYIFVLLAKIGIPILYLCYVPDLDINLIILPIIAVFYIYLVNMLYQTLNNLDLRKRVLYRETICKLMDYRNLDKSDFNKRIDITCSISLEAWDNARRIANCLDKEETEKYEISYIFLGIYYLFLALVCFSIFGDFYIIIGKNSIYMQGLLVIHVITDFCFITIILLIRVYYSQEFNDIFDKEKQCAQDVVGIYQDLITNFDHYFGGNLINICENEVYKNTVLKILEKSEFLVKNKLPFRGAVINSVQKLATKYIKANLQSLKKIQNQIERDQEEFKHLILGYFDQNFGEALATLGLGLLTTLPSILDKLKELLFGIKEEELRYYYQ